LKEDDLAWHFRTKRGERIAAGASLAGRGFFRRMFLAVAASTSSAPGTLPALLARADAVIE